MLSSVTVPDDMKLPVGHPAAISPWPMVVVRPDGSAWDAIGKVYKRLELGGSGYVPAFFAAAAARAR
jgi:hypothetical protein